MFRASFFAELSCQPTFCQTCDSSCYGNCRSVSLRSVVKQRRLQRLSRRLFFEITSLLPEKSNYREAESVGAQRPRLVAKNSSFHVAFKVSDTLVIPGRIDGSSGGTTAGPAPGSEADITRSKNSCTGQTLDLGETTETL